MKNDITISNTFKNNDGITTEQARVCAEIQAMVFIAKQYPRDENVVLQKVIQQCQRKSMAEVGMYSLPRAGQNITGASIRLAEALVRSYGNIYFGTKIISQDESVVYALAYCWDLETNNIKEDKFYVKLEKYTKKDGIKKLTDPREIYEHVASQCSRRLRGCILATIQGDILDAAIHECEKTLSSDSESLSERIKKLISSFAVLNVTAKMLEEYLKKNINAVNNTDFVLLRKIYQSIKDGMCDVSQYFGADTKTQQTADDVLNEIASTKQEKTPEVTETDSTTTNTTQLF